jgi:hypothetical protein
MYAMPHELRQKLALGHFGDFKNEYLQRHALFDAEFGLAARTIQRFYRGRRARRYLALAEAPGSRYRWRKPTSFSMKSLFEIAPPKAFIRRALRHQEAPARFQKELSAAQEDWVKFLQHEATPEEKAAFIRCSQQLVVARLDHIRTVEAQLQGLAAETISGVPTTAEFRTSQKAAREQRDAVAALAANIATVPALCVSVTASVPIFILAGSEFCLGAGAVAAAALMGTVPFLWPAGLLSGAFGISALCASAFSGTAAELTALGPPSITGPVARSVASSVTEGVQAMLPSSVRTAQQAQQRQLRDRLAQLAEICRKGDQAGA